MKYMTGTPGMPWSPKTGRILSRLDANERAVLIDRAQNDVGFYALLNAVPDVAIQFNRANQSGRCGTVGMPLPRPDFLGCGVAVWNGRLSSSRVWAVSDALSKDYVRKADDVPVGTLVTSVAGTATHTAPPARGYTIAGAGITIPVIAGIAGINTYAITVTDIVADRGSGDAVVRAEAFDITPIDATATTIAAFLKPSDILGTAPSNSRFTSAGYLVSPLAGAIAANQPVLVAANAPLVANVFQSFLIGDMTGPGAIAKQTFIQHGASGGAA